MSAPEPVNPVEEWKWATEVWMCRLCLISSDPDHEIDFWLEDATEGGDEYIQWAMDRWAEIRNLTSSDLERRLASLRPKGL